MGYIISYYEISLFSPGFLDDPDAIRNNIGRDAFHIPRYSRRIRDINEKSIIDTAGCQGEDMRMPFAEKPRYLSIGGVDIELHIDLLIDRR